VNRSQLVIAEAPDADGICNSRPRGFLWVFRR
jgi:hypothetical protein